MKLHCDIDDEKPFMKYVCMFLYAQDCDKHSLIWGPINVSEVFERLRVSIEIK